MRWRPADSTARRMTLLASVTVMGGGTAVDEAPEVAADAAAPAVGAAPLGGSNSPPRARLGSKGTLDTTDTIRSLKAAHEEHRTSAINSY
jgi:hypothetical protein